MQGTAGVNYFSSWGQAACTKPKLCPWGHSQCVRHFYKSSKNTRQGIEFKAFTLNHLLKTRLKNPHKRLKIWPEIISDVLLNTSGTECKVLLVFSTACAQCREFLPCPEHSWKSWKTVQKCGITKLPSGTNFYTVLWQCWVPIICWYRVFLYFRQSETHQNWYEISFNLVQMLKENALNCLGLYPS